MCSVSILLRMSYFFKSGVIISVRRGNIQNSLSYGVGKPYWSMKVGVERWRFRSFLMTLDCLCVSDKLSHHLFQVWESRTGIREYSSSPFKTVPCSFFFFQIFLLQIYGLQGRPREVMVVRENGAHEGETRPVLSWKWASKRVLRRQFQIHSSLCTLFSRWYHKERNSPIVFAFFQILPHCKPRTLVTTRS